MEDALVGLPTPAPVPTDDDALPGGHDSLADAAEELLGQVVAQMGGHPRAGQVAMTRAIAESLDSDGRLLVDAGTGTGKSLGYLVPAYLHARRTGKPMVVATASKVLQSQLVDEDLPRLARVVDVSWALLKGRANYACLVRTNEVLADPGAVDVRGPQDTWDRLLSWVETTPTGDYAETPAGTPPGMFANLAVSGSECAGSECKLKNRCFSNLARSRALDVDIVVVNTHYLLLDHATNGSLLPHPVAGVICDEAHKIREVAESVYGLDVAASRLTQIRRVASRYLSDRDIRRVDKAVEGFNEALADLPTDRRVTPSTAGLEEPMKAMVAAAERVVLAVSSAPQNAKLVEDDDDDDDKARLELVRNMRSKLAEDVDALLNATDLVCQVQERGRSRALTASPLTVADLLAESLFGNFDSVIGTSATLTVGGKFDHVADEIGMDRHPGGWTGLRVESPFDYRRQAVLYVPRLPEPNHPDWDERSRAETLRLIQAAGGRALLLFTSNRRLAAVSEWIAEQIDQQVIVQGTAPLGQLLESFAADETSVLCGTMSLYEGVSVPGRSLSLVVMDRLPFPRRDDPLVQARRDAADAGHGNGFMDVDLPLATVRLAQGFGRLVRTTADAGLVAVLDTRLATKRYRSVMLDSLPAGTNRSMTFDIEHGDIALRLGPVLAGTAEEIAASLSPADLHAALTDLVSFLGPSGVPVGPWLKLMIARGLQADLRASQAA